MSKRLDGLADADVVGDRGARIVSWRSAMSSGTSWYGRGSTAIRAKLRNGPAPSRTERRSAWWRRRADAWSPRSADGRRREAWRARTSCALEGKVDARDLVVGAAERAQDEEGIVALGQDDPLTPARADEGCRA